MNILITGGTGFIGRYLIKELEKYSYSIEILSRDLSKVNLDVVIKKGDLTKSESLSLALKGVDAVFHNAAFATDTGNRKKIYRTNVIGTKNLAEACIKNNITRIIYTSSAGVYGFPNSMEQITENYPKNPYNAYQKSKLKGEIILQSYTGLHTSIIRPPLVLGNGGMVSKVLLENLKNNHLAYIGNGNNFVPIAHACDVSQCLRLALENDVKGEIFNVVSFTCTVKQLFKELAKQLSIPETTKHVPYIPAYLASVISEKFSLNPRLTRFRLKTLATNRLINCEKAKSMLGFQPQYDLEKTIEDVIKSVW